jgi:hypothetical protein
MALFTQHPSNTLYKGTILLGCLAFLLGVAGIFYFRYQERQLLPDGDLASVLVHGVENDPDIQVVARWPIEEDESGDGAGAAPTWGRETGRLGAEPGIYLFHRAPGGVRLELIVYRHEGKSRRELHRQAAILTYGQNIYTAVPPGPASPR